MTKRVGVKLSNIVFDEVLEGTSTQDTSLMGLNATNGKVIRRVLHDSALLTLSRENTAGQEFARPSVHRIACSKEPL